MISFSDLIDARIIRKIITHFRTTATTLCNSTKCKYLSKFDAFLKFLMCDVDSPERVETATNDEKILRDISYKEIKEEIQSCIQLINSKNGKESIAKKKVQRTNIISAAEIDGLSEQLTKSLAEVVAAGNSGTISSYTQTQAIKVRNDLISI